MIFKTEQAAKDHASSLRDSVDRFGKLGRRVSPDLIRTALEFEDLAIEYGFSGLRDFCAKGIARIDQVSRSPLLRELLDSYHADRAHGWSEKYKTDRWKPFRTRLADLEETSIALLDEDAWRQWLTTWTEASSPAPSTFNQQLGMLRALFNQGSARKVHAINPLDGIAGRKGTSKAASVFTPDEAARILAVAWEYDRAMVPWFATAIFAGLRPDSELVRCRFEHFNWNEGHLRVLVTKTGSKHRFVEISDTLRAWLQPWMLKRGHVRPVKNFRRRYEQLVRGFYTTPGATMKNRSEWKPLAAWDTDITRHTYGSYFEAQHRAEANCRQRLADFMGHESYKTFDSHYRNARTKKEAEAFWGLRPPVAITEKIVAIA